MDLPSYYTALLNAAWYLVPLFIFAITIRSAWFKGVIGE